MKDLKRWSCRQMLSFFLAVSLLAQTPMTAWASQLETGGTESSEELPTGEEAEQDEGSLQGELPEDEEPVQGEPPREESPEEVMEELPREELPSEELPTEEVTEEPPTEESPAGEEFSQEEIPEAEEPVSETETASWHLEGKLVHLSMSCNAESGVSGSRITVQLQAEEGFVIPAGDSCIRIMAETEEEEPQELDFQTEEGSEDQKTRIISFVLPELQKEQDARIVLHAEAVKQYVIQKITAEAEDGTEEDILDSVRISPSVLYEGVTVAIWGIPEMYEEISLYPADETEAAGSVVRSDGVCMFTMPDFDVELFCEQAVPPILVDPEDIYTPSMEFVYGERSAIPDEPDMQVYKTADWINIQAGEAQVTIAEKALDQYTNLPCDYVIMVDCSRTMSRKDQGSKKTRYQLANEAITMLLNRIEEDNALLAENMKSRVALITYSGAKDNGSHPTQAKETSSYYAGDDQSDYFYSGVYEYSGFTTNVGSVKKLLNLNIRPGSRIHMALDKVLDLLEAKGLNTKRKTKVINLSDCGNDWDGRMREGYFKGNFITSWKGVKNPEGITADDKIAYIKDHYGASFMQICIGTGHQRSDIERTSLSEASGDHLFWTYDGTESRFGEIFSQIHEVPFEIRAVSKVITDLFDTTYWEAEEVTSCTTGMDTVSLEGDRLIWRLPDEDHGSAQTCTVRIRLKEKYRYQSVSDTSYRTNADREVPGLTYQFTIDGGIHDQEQREGSVKTPFLLYGTVEFDAEKVWTVEGSQASSITTALYQKLPGLQETQIDGKIIREPEWKCSYTNAERQAAGKYPYVKYNNQGELVSYTLKEQVPRGYTALPEKTNGVQTTFYNEPYKIKAALQKVDEETKNPLSGAIFSVYQWSIRSGSWIPYKGSTDEESDAGYEKGTMDSGKILQLQEQEKGMYVTPSWLYYTADNSGRFAVAETKAPEGYYGDWKDDSLVTDHASEEDKVFYELKMDAAGSNTGKEVRIAIENDGILENQRVLGQITFEKKDLESGLAFPQGETTFAGAEYKLYAAETILHADGTTGILYQKGEEIPLRLAGTGSAYNVYVLDEKGKGGTGTITLPAGGKAVIRNLELGTYELKEQKAPEGYLIQPDAYEVSLDYQNERESIVKVNGISVYDQAKKQKLSFYKVTGYGQEGQLMPLAGAKFSVYRVSDLHGGAYAQASNEEVVQSIIDDYRDEVSLLYEKIKQERPVQVYAAEDSESVQTGQLTKSVTYATGETHEAIGMHAYLAAELVSDEQGIVTIPELPFGRYAVVETTTPKEKIAARPFVYSVTGDDVHGTVNSPDDQNGSRLQDQIFLADRPVSALVRIEKTDSCSGKAVLTPGAQYVLHDLDGAWFAYVMKDKTTAEKKAYQKKYGDLVVQYVQGTDMGTKEHPYSTKLILKNGEQKSAAYIDTAQPLPTGRYELEEIQAPEGYILQGKEGVIRKKDGQTFYETKETGTWEKRPQERTRFVISSEYAVYDASAGQLVVKVRQKNTPAVGKISIQAKEEVLVGADRSFFQKYRFVYESRPAAGEVFEIRAAEEIYEPMYGKAAREALKKNGETVEPLYHDGDVVERLVTDEKGQAWTGTEDDPETGSPKGLPLGKYRIIRIQNGAEQQLQEIEIAYAGQEVPVIYQDIVWETSPKKLQIEVKKEDADTGTALAGAVFGLYSKEEIRNDAGKLVLEPDTLIGTAVSGQDGIAVFPELVPASLYYVRELKAPNGYTCAENLLEVPESGEGGIQILCMDKKIKTHSSDSESEEPSEPQTKSEPEAVTAAETKDTAPMLLFARCLFLSAVGISAVLVRRKKKNSFIHGSLH